MSEDFLRIAQLEEQRLIAELRLIPAFQKLEAITILLDIYRSAAGADSPQVVAQIAAHRPPAEPTSAEPTPVILATRMSTVESPWRQAASDAYKVDKVFR